ncbi:hypothetical protein B0J13DRAFT_526288 [Dactylonectria estremocensis]|uniref:Uncharacterized protein n=1 Tax=Dactylonectria estremocensis TaxID=1079267 RepID=A0A9P9J206_9HYPO|nr:hypothetical protein B0J13DRAFT_526288 [Dactylonectria estremocensis]
MVFDHLKAVGPELATVLPRDDAAWHKKSHLRRLNFSVFYMIILSSANGHDESLMNGLQALPQGGSFMNHPTGAWLRFVNAIQSLGAEEDAFAAYFWLSLGVGMQAGARNPAMSLLRAYDRKGVMIVAVPSLV